MVDELFGWLDGMWEWFTRHATPPDLPRWLTESHDCVEMPFVLDVSIKGEQLDGVFKSVYLILLSELDLDLTSGDPALLPALLQIIS